MSVTERLERRRLFSVTVTEDSPGFFEVNGDGAHYSFSYDAGQGWQSLQDNDDGSILSTSVAGGFVGTVLGPYARQE